MILADIGCYVRLKMIRDTETRNFGSDFNGEISHVRHKKLVTRPIFLRVHIWLKRLDYLVDFAQILIGIEH